ncbi:MAG: autotransporter-associated beta strand repeat-containing protein [Chthoniobacterales bacterium]|nr:autotransporter-associated beta strand repeat-containing protein [Chthoniobacterales bacterium]
MKNIACHLAAVVVLISAAQADSLWKGGTGPWNVGTNWFGDNVPDYSSVVLIDAGTATLATGVNGAGYTLLLDGGNLLVDGGILHLDSESILGDAASTTGVATVNGGEWVSLQYLTIGNFGSGTLYLNGGVVASSYAEIGLGAAGSGAAHVSGGRWETVAKLSVGYFGSGTLAISGSGEVVNAVTAIGDRAGSTGMVTLSGGVLHTGQVMEESGSGSLTFNGGTLRASASSTNFISGFESGDVMIHAGGAFIDSGGFSVASSVGLGGGGVLTKQGSGTLTLAGNNTYTGGTVVNGGVLELSGGIINHGSTALQVANQVGGTGAMVVSSGGWVTSGGSSQIASPLDSTGSMTVTGLASQWTVTGNLVVGNFANSKGTLTIDTLGLVSVGAGTGTLTLAQNALGPSLSEGTLNIGAGGAAGTLQAAEVTGGAGTAAVNFNHTGAHTFAPRLTGSLSLNKLAAGTTTLTGSNTYTGGTTVSGGVLALGGAASIADSSGVDVGVGATFDISGLTNAGTAIRSLTGSGQVALGAKTLTIDLGGSALFAGSLGGAGGGLTKLGSGTLSLTGDSTYTGDTTITVGQLNVGAGGSLDTGSGDFFVGYNGSGSLNIVTGGSVTTDQFYIGRFSGNSGDARIGGELKASNVVVGYQGAGTATLTGVGVIDTAAIVLGNSGGSSGLLNFGNGNSTGTTTATNIRGNHASGGGTVNFNHTGSFTLGASLTSHLAVTKTGTGTTTLTGTNTYSRGTTISSGALIITDIGPSASVMGTGDVEVEQNGTLAGTGTVLGDTIVAGTLAPGNSPGAMAFSGDLFLEGTATVKMELASLALFDTIHVGGLLTYDGTLSISLLDGYLPEVGDMFDLFDSGPIQPTGAFNAVLFDTPNYTGSFNESTGVLIIMTVPEPSTYALALAGLLAALAFGRRKRCRP